MRTAKEMLTPMSFTNEMGEKLLYFTDAVKLVNEARSEAIKSCIEIVNEQNILGYPEQTKPLLIKLFHEIK